eukprot:5864710-Pleurochrysis_carterae.AAC.3
MILKLCALKMWSDVTVSKQLLQYQLHYYLKVIHHAATLELHRVMSFRHSASVTYSPICHWESGDRMAPLTQHSSSSIY